MIGFVRSRYRSLRSWTACFFWARPSLYKWIGILRSRGNVSESSCDIVFDGFPRSGNTFGAQMLTISQDDRIKVQFHKHLPPFLISAILLHKPVCLTIRPPEDAIISWVIYTHGDPGLMLEKYIDFYTVMLPHRTKLLVVPFYIITEDFKTVLELINCRFELDLKMPFDLDSCKREAFHRIDNIWRDDSGKIKEWQVARPCPSRADLRNELLEELKDPQYQDLLQEALSLYDTFHRDFQRDLAKYIHPRETGNPL